MTNIIGAYFTILIDGEEETYRLVYDKPIEENEISIASPLGKAIEKLSQEKANNLKAGDSGEFFLPNGEKEKFTIMKVEF